MNALVTTLGIVVALGLYLVCYGGWFLKKTGKVMGLGWMIIGIFLCHLAWWSFNDYRDAIGERVDRITFMD